MRKINRTLVRDCGVGADCPAVHETSTETTSETAGETIETGGHLVQGYDITDQAVLAFLGARPGERAVRLSLLLAADLVFSGVSAPWLRWTPDKIPAAVGAAVPNPDELLAPLGRALPAGELLIDPRPLEDPLC